MRTHALATFDRLFDDFIGGALASRGSGDEAPILPSADVRETSKAFELSFDLPGIPKEDVAIELDDGLLTVSGTRKSERTERDEAGEGRRVVERQFGRFERSFRIPVEVDAEKVKAAFKDGVLRLTIPKAERSRPRQITIQ